MASRAHSIPDYFTPVTERPRRAVRYPGPVRYPGGDDPVVLPRGKSRSGGAAAVLIASAIVATSVIAGGAYAVYAGAGAPMSETPVAPLTSTWTPDSEPFRAQATGLIHGSNRTAQTAPALATTPVVEQKTDTPLMRSAPDKYFIDDSRPDSQTKSEPAPLTPPVADPIAPQPIPYPNPTTTPPDAIAPPGVSPEQPTPLLESENPYR